MQGNAWGFITGRDGYGYPTGIEWLPPQDVDVQDDETQPWNPLRSRIYAYGRLMDRQELFHVKAFSVAGRTEGISPLRAFALTILAGLEAQRYGTDWYRSGGFPPGHVPEQRDRDLRRPGRGNPLDAGQHHAPARAPGVRARLGL